MLRTLNRAHAEIGVDLGTSNIRLVSRGRGVVLDEPSVVATSHGTGGHEVVAIGLDAKKMLGRNPPGTEVVRPIRAGVVDDFKATEQLIHQCLKRAGAGGLVRPRVLVSIPSDTTEVERRAVRESTRAAGAREVTLIASAMCAAVGADLPIEEPVGSLVVDIGGGRTDVAVISLGGMVVHRSAPVAGDDMDRALTSWLAQIQDLQIGERTAELLKLQVGAAIPDAPQRKMRTRGRDTNTGSPRELDVDCRWSCAALTPVIERIRDVVLGALAATPPELSADIVDRGVILAGGSSHLVGLDHILREATGLPVLAVESPAQCVARGLERVLEDTELFSKLTALT